ncbi:tautomerase family protein [Niallia sp. Man26]|uniref:tautomerase family protein n=1 Tax=Niallia sp. Man26 TaxID=2912824 RepID=UPI001EDC6217|nr:tautomerase family protein [Niallia sp. Man26]UPO90170.1 tautomerase family protein [Niallia sp. Man26]
MPIVNINIAPELLHVDKEEAYKEMVKGITRTISESAKVPAEAVHVMINETSAKRYSVAGKFLIEK